MPIFARTKSVTGPLDDRVKNRIVGYDVSQTDVISSGSEHSSTHHVISPSSHCISDLCHCFLQHNTCAGETYDRSDGYDLNRTDSDSDTESKHDPDSDSERTDVITDGLVSVLRNLNVDRHRNLLLSHVIKALEISRSIKPNNQNHNRNVMLYLQKLGHNAAVCKASWNSCGGQTAGNHEFIDVVRTDTGGDRYFIDINFASEFEIARETKHFRGICNHLPTVFVGKQEHLKQIVKLLSDAARESLKTRGLLLPPWRKNRFMQNKWFGPYRRTLNYTPTKINISSTTSSSGVKYCLYGFNAVSVSNGAALLPVATRTR